MAGKARGRGQNTRPIILRREEARAHGHHGGAWKVAYADFVTAMMAFFLLMWLLNATTEEQRHGLADFFAPMNVLGRSVSGSGEPFGGKNLNTDAAMVSDQGAVRVELGDLPARLDPDTDGEAPGLVTAAATPGPNAPGPGQGAPAPRPVPLLPP
ncbi:MAG TPA: flagellar motor protein MotB, partial [Crenalkalicoccus sp.]|nr:flagellar motor protein MotB [Crenalkalicoccus sp.]